MKELLEYLVKLIVKDPSAVQVTEETTPDYVNLKVSVAPEETGLVIGKGGKIISALRQLVRVKAIKENKKVSVELAESLNLPPSSA